MQLTQHAEVGGLEGQESSASSLWSLTRGGVGWGGQQRTDSGPGHHQVIRPGGLASFLLLPTPGLAYQTLLAQPWPRPQLCPAPPRPALRRRPGRAQVRGARLRTRFSSSAGNLVWNWQRVPLL